MADGPWRRVSASRTASVGAALLAVLLVLCSSALAGAQPVRLVPSSAGYLGAWLVAGPVAAADVEALEPGSVEPELGSAVGHGRWRVLSAAESAIDLKQSLRAGRKAGPYALVGGVLELQHALEGWLLISADGALSAWVDGGELLSRDAPRLRHSSWDALPLKLAAGRHTLLLAIQHPGDHWAFELRLLSAGDGLPPAGAALLLPGTEHSRERLARALTVTRLSPGLSTRGYQPRLRVEHPRGALLGHELPVRAAGRWSRNEALFEVRAGEVVAGPRGVQPFEVRLPPLAELPKRPRLLTVKTSVGDRVDELRVPVDPGAPAALARAEAQSRALPTQSIDPEAVRATIELRADAVRHADTLVSLRDALASLKRLGDTLAQERDPLTEPGILELALRSPIDGEPEGLSLHVPASYRPGSDRRYPLVVALHGYNGSPEGILGAFLDTPATSANPNVDGFVVAPVAFGNSFYRDAGEAEVVRVLDWVVKHYPIDPNRLSITGVSMGGTGAAYVGFRYADRFAAVAPLCGYHSYFIRRDTSNRPIRPWERQRMHHWSTTSWAERARQLAVHVAHGTKDYPLANSRVLIDRLKALGYSVSQEWPETGHHVWDVTYAGARMWPELTRHRRDPEPAHVTLVTDALRYGSQYWLELERLSQSGSLARADAEVVNRHEIRVTTEGVGALRVHRPKSHVDANAPLWLKLDGTRLQFAPGQPLQAHRGEAGWLKGPGPTTGKSAGLEGPIRDAFLDPLSFVYGSLDEATRRANREVAEVLARGYYGVELRYPVLADRDVDAALLHGRHLFLVGTPHDHLLLARLAAKLPIGVDGEAIRVGQQRYRGRDVGAIFVYPNPLDAKHYVVVVTAPSLSGIYRALSLPQLLPDFLVYDEGLAPAAGEQVLGMHASVRAGGFFEPDWSLPSEFADPQAPKR